MLSLATCQCPFWLMRRCFLGRWICLLVSEGFRLVWWFRLFDNRKYIPFCVHWHGGQCLQWLVPNYAVVFRLGWEYLYICMYILGIFNTLQHQSHWILCNKISGQRTANDCMLSSEFIDSDLYILMLAWIQQIWITLILQILCVTMTVYKLTQVGKCQKQDKFNRQLWKEYKSDLCLVWSNWCCVGIQFSYNHVLTLRCANTQKWYVYIIGKFA